MRPKIETKIVNPLIGSTIPLPTYATDGAAGMDLRACIDEAVVLRAGETQLIGSGIAIHINDSQLMAVLVPRSGLGSKGVVLGNLVGVIDSCYQGEIKIALWNRGKTDFTIQQGDRLCQMLFVPVVQVDLEVVNEFSEQTARGEGGFGHTGVK